MSPPLTPLRIGLLGAGYIARKRVAPAIQKATWGCLAVVASRSHARAQELAKDFEAPSVEGYEKVINDEEVDCVYIALPNALHFEWAMRAAQAGKHILCEKPAFLNLRDTETVLELCAKKGVRFMEAYMFRFHPQHQVVRKLLDARKIGEAHHFEGVFGFPRPAAENFRHSYVLGGGSLNDVGGYLLTASRLHFQEEPRIIYAQLYPLREKSVDERGVIYLGWENGRTASLLFGFDYYYRNMYAIWGSEGHLTLQRAFSIPADMPLTVDLQTVSGVEQIEGLSCDQFVAMIDTFCRATMEPDTNAFNFEMEAWKLARLMENARLSAQKGKPISLGD